MNNSLTIDERRQHCTKVLRNELKREGLLLDTSDHLLEQAAITRVELDDLQRIVDKQGIVYTTASRNGSTMRRTNPAYTELKDLRKAWLKLLIQMGLTPLARKRLGIVAYDSEFD